jgi:flagellar motor protein MotB
MSVQIGSPITSEQRGYRRGLILGLTMAESMLLLVFCLLLAAGAMLIKERKDAIAVVAERDQLKEMQEKFEKAEADLLFLQEKIRQMPQLEQRPIEEWRELDLAKQQLDQLEEAELKLTEIIENAEVVKAVLERKLTIEDIETAAWVAENAEVVKAVIEQKMTVEDITMMSEAVEKLKSIKEDGTTPTPEELDDIVKATKTLIGQAEIKEMSVSAALEEIIRKAALYVESDGPDKPHEWPPIINLSEADSYFFRSGSAELSPSFEEMLTAKIAPQIAETATQYAVDIIEVIGHTDEQRMGRRQSNLDEEIKTVLTGRAAPSKLQAADNAGLGLSRAIAVSEVLKRVPNLQHFTILPMSGAQLILPGDNLTDGSQLGDVASRRRIEIRVRKRNDLMQATQAQLDSAAKFRSH